MSALCHHPPISLERLWKDNIVQLCNDHGWEQFDLQFDLCYALLTMSKWKKKLYVGTHVSGVGGTFIDNLNDLQLTSNKFLNHPTRSFFCSKVKTPSSVMDKLRAFSLYVCGHYISIIAMAPKISAASITSKILNYVLAVSSTKFCKLTKTNLADKPPQSKWQSSLNSDLGISRQCKDM